MSARIVKGMAVRLVRSDVLAAVDGAPDLIVANPPYMRDHAARAYRDGGGSHGEELSLRIAREALARARFHLLFVGDGEKAVCGA